MLYAQVHLTLPPWIHETVDVRTMYVTDDEKMALAVRLSECNVR